MLQILATTRRPDGVTLALVKAQSAYHVGMLNVYNEFIPCDVATFWSMDTALLRYMREAMKG